MASRRTAKKSEWHAHGCAGCKTRFEDACSEPNTAVECSDCRTGKRVRSQLLIDARAPKSCCVLRSRLARKDEVEKYRLSRSCMWFICEACKRTHPFNNPREAAPAHPALMRRKT